MAERAPSQIDAWLATQPAWYAKRFYAGMAVARETHAMSLLKDNGDDTTGALRHMQIVRDYEQKAAAIRLSPQ